MLKEAWSCKRSYFLLQLFDIIFQVAAPFVEIIFTPLLIDELLGGRRIKLLIIYTALVCIGGIACTFGTNFVRISEERIAVLFENRISEQMSRRVMELDFQLTEDKDALDQIEKARTGMSWYSDGIHGIIGSLSKLVSSLLKIVGSVGVIAYRAPVLIPVTVVLMVITILLQRKLSQISIESFKSLSKLNRIFDYLFYEITDVKNGKDIRLYSAEDMMLKKAAEYNNGSLEQSRWEAKKGLPANLTLSACDCVRDAANYFTAGYLAVMGKITIGVFSQIISAANALHLAMRRTAGAAQELIERCNYAYEYLKFSDYPPALKKGSKSVENTSHTIEFKNVSFTYPNTTVEALKNISITLRPGERLSVVGLNGAGKTTLIKLLCRLYDVTDGEILLDGVNIAEYDIEEYMKLFSVVFQDFKLFAFSVEENITLGEKGKDVQKYVQLSGLDGAFENGADTMLFKQFQENGVEPSGGQQQKLAIARALFKDSPVVILDEPTAALDPLAEYEIYNSFDKLVGSKTAVYISHRLSSCKFCDRIAVFSDGCIKELGSHDELIAVKDGIYAQMFNAQAQYYT